MNISAQQYNSISRFLDADMTYEEMEAFEEELKQYPDMRAQLVFEQSIRDEWSVRPPSLQNTAEPTIKANSKPSIYYKRLWIAAASIVVIIGCYYAVRLLKTQQQITANKPQPVAPPAQVNTTPTDSNKKTELPDAGKSAAVSSQLFVQYFTKDSIPEQYPIILADALERYEDGDMTAILQFNADKLPDTRSAGDAEAITKTKQLANYYKGIALLSVNKAQEALPALLNTGKNTPLSYKAQWYIALAYLAINDRNNCTAYLEKVIKEKPGNIYQQKATQLLKDLQKQ